MRERGIGGRTGGLLVGDEEALDEETDGDGSPGTEGSGRTGAEYGIVVAWQVSCRERRIVSDGEREGGRDARESGADEEAGDPPFLPRSLSSG